MKFEEWLMNEYGTQIPASEIDLMHESWDAALENQWVLIDEPTPKQTLPDCGVDVIAWDGFDCARAWVNAKGEWCSYEGQTDFCTSTVQRWMPIPE